MKINKKLYEEINIMDNWMIEYKNKIIHLTNLKNMNNKNDIDLINQLEIDIYTFEYYAEHFCPFGCEIS